MDAIHLQAVLPEIEAALSGRPVTRVELWGKFGVLLRFSGSRRDLYLSAHPELSRAGLLDRPPALGPARPAPDNLAKPLEGARLEAAEQEPNGRVVRFRFSKEGADHARPVLVGELIPRFANAVLVGAGERILWSARAFEGRRPREIAPGRPYVPPAAGAPPASAASEAPPGAPPPAETVNGIYGLREEREARDQLLGELRRMLVRRRTRAAKALRHIEGRAEEAAREPRIRREAELLAAHLPLAKRGMREVTVPDFDGSAHVTIPLDPKLEPRQNLDALFKKARRLARGVEEIETQRAIQAAAIAEADHALGSLDPPPELERLREIAGRLAPSLLEGPPSRGAGQRGAAAEDGPGALAALPPGFTPRRYVLPGGWEVWAGRNSRQNDELTHRHASQRDLWFHARGSEGSHTVLRVGSGKGEPPKEILLAAARIAAYHSGARNSKLVPVAYTEKRYVRKPRGAPAGLAVMMREKVVMVEPRLP
jgi:predicted ribosome quality control (RQC) complex YloA/Tae2 family protein